MATFVKIDERSAAIIVAAVAIGVAFLVAPEQAMDVVQNISDSIKGVLP